MLCLEVMVGRGRLQSAIHEGWLKGASERGLKRGVSYVLLGRLAFKLLTHEWWRYRMLQMIAIISITRQDV